METVSNSWIVLKLYQRRCWWRHHLIKKRGTWPRAHGIAEITKHHASSRALAPRILSPPRCLRQHRPTACALSELAPAQLPLGGRTYLFGQHLELRLGKVHELEQVRRQHLLIAHELEHVNAFRRASQTKAT